MKKLFLFRHAKSSWADESVADHERPLNRRGKMAAPMMGRWFADNFDMPDVIICSTATRTRETIRLFVSASGYSGDVCYESRIYMAHPEDIAGVLCEVDDSAGSLMVVGHNPGMQGLATALASEPVRMPTAAIAGFELAVEQWLRFRTGSDARLIVHQVPKELPDSLT